MSANQQAAKELPHVRKLRKLVPHILRAQESISALLDGEEFTYYFRLRGTQNQGPKLPLGDPYSSLHSLSTLIGLPDLKFASTKDDTALALALSPVCKVAVVETWKVTWVGFAHVGVPVRQTPTSSFKLWANDALGVRKKLEQIEWLGELLDRVDAVLDDDGLEADKLRATVRTLLRQEHVAEFALHEVLSGDAYTKRNVTVPVTHKNHTEAVFIRVPVRKKGQRTRVDQVNFEALIKALCSNDFESTSEERVISDIVTALGKIDLDGVVSACRRLKLVVVKQLRADFYNGLKARLNIREKQFRTLIRYLRPLLGNTYLFEGHRACKKAAQAYRIMRSKLNFVKVLPTKAARAVIETSMKLEGDKIRKVKQEWDRVPVTDGSHRHYWYDKAKKVSQWAPPAALIAAGKEYNRLKNALSAGVDGWHKSGVIEMMEFVLQEVRENPNVGLGWELGDGNHIFGVVISGDSGGGSTKIMQQYLYARNQDATSTGSFLGSFRGKDTAENVRLRRPHGKSRSDVQCTR
jgi:hypothetical protein